MKPGDELVKAARLLLQARPFPVLTGAGISVESGIPTFHGPEGLWSRYDPYEYGHIDTFLEHPERTWELLLEIIRSSISARPNRAHELLAKMEMMNWCGPVITQNVDGFHGLAGSQNVIELHGNARRIRCMKCSFTETLDPEGLEAFQINCYCGGMKRPEVVLYGEDLPMSALMSARESCYGCKGVLVIGTSGIVYPAASLPGIVHDRGFPVVEMDPTETALTGSVADVSIRMGASSGLEALFDAMERILDEG
ncbi:MAG: NAD-dependent protein deacylase [Candidatus Thermoplasmatota archaeon]|nr:NAD-dependent protein deacylase [Candidatus Thermoplasmatota archaeon]